MPDGFQSNFRLFAVRGMAAVIQPDHLAGPGTTRLNGVQLFVGSVLVLAPLQQ